MQAMGRSFGAGGAHSRVSAWFEHPAVREGGERILRGEAGELAIGLFEAACHFEEFGLAAARWSSSCLDADARSGGGRAIPCS